MVGETQGDGGSLFHGAGRHFGDDMHCGGGQLTLSCCPPSRGAALLSLLLATLGSCGPEAPLGLGTLPDTPAPCQARGPL